MCRYMCVCQRWGNYIYSENRCDHGNSTCQFSIKWMNIKYEVVSHFSVDSDELMSISLCPGWEDNVIQFFSTLFDAWVRRRNSRSRRWMERRPEGYHLLSTHVHMAYIHYLVSAPVWTGLVLVKRVLYTVCDFVEHLGLPFLSQIWGTCISATTVIHGLI